MTESTEAGAIGLAHGPSSAAPTRLLKAAALLQMGRLKFLLYSPIMYGLGAAVGIASAGRVNAGKYFFGLGVVWVTHAMTHYCNEYFDYEADVANVNATPFTGGSRVLVNGLLPRSAALRAAIALTAVSLLMMLGLPTASAKVVGLAAIALAWMYSAPPFRLVGRGLGEITVVLVLNVLTPVFACTVQGGAVGASLLAVVFPLGIIGYMRMLVMSIPDREGDAAAGKRTLVVRLGPEAVVRIHNAGMFAAYASLPLLVGAGLPGRVATGIALTAPLAAWQAVRLSAGAWRSSAMIRSVPFWASTHNALAALMALVGSLALRGATPASTIAQLFPVVLYLGSLAFFWLRARR
jgi:1,4-dihydroxy-2-naphthoate octaprenyltransferase